MNRIKTLLTQHVSVTEKLVHRLLNTAKIERCGGGPRYEDHLEIVRQMGAVSTIDLPEKSLDSVAYHGLAHFTGHGKSNPSSLPFAPDHIEDKCLPHPLLPVPVDG
jgi:hypothetical protein